MRKLERGGRLGLLLCAVVSWLLTAVSLTTTSPQTQADFIRVGQGDSILLQDGNGFDVLIDGGRTSAGPAVLAHLRAQGITDLDVMLATHADADHIGGLIAVLNADDIAVQQVLYNGYPGSTQTWGTFAAAVANEGLTLTPAQFPSEYVWGGLTVEVLHPDPGLVAPEQNRASVVLYVHHAEVDYLLAADIDSPAEATVVARAGPISAEVLKVAHHGSAYSSSSAFITEVAPSDAVISVGNNPYGHPTTETLTRLGLATIWRTHRDGIVTVISTGDAYTVTAQLSQLVFLPVLRR